MDILRKYCEKSFYWIPLQKCHKIFLHIFLSNKHSKHLFYLEKKKLEFLAATPPPLLTCVSAKNASFFTCSLINPPTPNNECIHSFSTSMDLLDFPFFFRWASVHSV